MAERVLVDGDHFLICQDGGDLGCELGQVVARKQRRGQHGPHAHVRAVLIQRQPAVAHLEHVRIVPVAWARVLCQADVGVGDQRDAGEVFPHIIRCAPQVAAD